MQATVQRIMSYMEDIAPASIAMPGDPVGLQLGDPDAEISKILVALDPDQTALDEAIACGAEMLVTHHPLFYNKLSSIDESTPAGHFVASAIRNRRHIFCAHTNFDVAPQGVSHQLLKRLGLKAESLMLLEKTGNEQLLKLVVFIPVGHEDDIREALVDAGAGQIGSYSHCTFQTEGQGTFMPADGTKPFIGSSCQLETVDEVRLETILPATRRSNVLRALLQAHPYEEVAYDLYPLDLEGRAIGMGLLVDLAEPLTIDILLQICRERLKTESIRFATSAKTLIKRVALCGGSGGSLIEHAAYRRADLFISGDFRYHDLKLAQSLGIALIDAGHDSTEIPAVQYLQQYLEKRIMADGFKTAVLYQTTVQAGWN
jgi:dinuclear metal center YbgI/SA1388 family protein